MYRYFHQTNAEGIIEEESVGLHDCRADRMSLQKGMLSFYFSDGFYVMRNDSAGRKVFYTEEAQAEFPLLYSDADDITIYVFTEENEKTIREEYTVDDFINLINEKSYSLEFLYSYIGYQTFKFDCWLWFDEEPYHKECELIISAGKVFYRWNTMHEE
ncbi:MAG TPA: hypothetical protein DDY31_03340 [Lachnospiraceae bacterium]|nr:hypothetical protein [Lachnospiraceae bacterium]